MVGLCEVMGYVSWVILINFALSAADSQSCQSGRCHVPQTSLMQLDVQGNQRQLLSTKERSSRSAALAGFEKYAMEMAQKVTGDPDPVHGDPGHDTNLSDDDRDAIMAIKDFVEQAYYDWKSEHLFDKSLVEQECEHKSEKCFHDWFTTQDISNTTTRNCQIAHRDCRAEQYHFSWTACDKYDHHRKSAAGKLPDCVKHGDLTHEKLKLPDERVQGVNVLRQVVEPCLDMAYEWIQPLHMKYLDCLGERHKYLEKNHECKTKQIDFEKTGCYFGIAHDERCYNYEDCLRMAFDDCDDICAEIEEVVKARTADNETAVRVVCLLDVLLSKNEHKTEALADCVDPKNYEDLAEYWKIPCPTNGHPHSRPHIPPPHIPCPADHGPKFIAMRVPCQGHPVNGFPHDFDHKMYHYNQEEWYSDLTEGTKKYLPIFKDCERQCEWD